MSSSSNKQANYGASFLPDDYLRRKAEGRSGLIMLGLSCIVMFGIVAAFFVTNRQWTTVKRLQGEINKQYTQEAQKIDQLKTLEAQKVEMLDKADVTIALIERVPRSILLAELINRMPGDLTLTDFELKSRKMVDGPTEKAEAKPKPRSLAGKPTKGGKGKAGGKDAKDKAPEKPKPVRFEYALIITGLSRTDQEIADYTASLQQCGLIDKVEFKYSGDVIINEVSLRKFRIETLIRLTADAREIEPLHVPRLAMKAADGAFRAPEDPAAELLKRAGVKGKGANQKSTKGVAGVAGDKE